MIFWTNIPPKFYGRYNNRYQLNVTYCTIILSHILIIIYYSDRLTNLLLLGHVSTCLLYHSLIRLDKLSLHCVSSLCLPCQVLESATASVRLFFWYGSMNPSAPNNTKACHILHSLKGKLRSLDNRWGLLKNASGFDHWTNLSLQRNISCYGNLIRASQSQ